MIFWLLACAGVQEPEPMPPAPVVAVEDAEPAPEPPTVALSDPALPDGQVLQAPATPIEIRSPVDGAVIPGGQLVISGVAQVFEGHVHIRVTRGDEVLSDSVVTVAAAPEFGAFELSIPVSPGPAQIEVFSRSARDGSAENQVLRQVVLE